jgi:photosystem II stability/assembly factor-like uncharacterized protein
MRQNERFLMGSVFFMPLLVLLGWYFWVTHGSDGANLMVREKMLTPHDELFDVVFKNGEGWIVGKFGLILHSEDNGKTWKAEASGTTNALTAVSFFDKRRGIVVGSRGTILVTRDGGRSWAARKSESDDHLLGVHAVSPNSVFVVGAFGTILYSSDGGETWTRQKLPWESLIPGIIKDSGYIEPNLNTVFFMSPEIGWVGGEFGLILHTRDGGQTWVSQVYDMSLPQILGIGFRDAATGWAVGQQGTFLRTLNAGKVWMANEVVGDKALYGISIYEDKGVVVGDGIVFKTDDAGATWVRSVSYEDISLSGVAVNRMGAVAVGSGGAIRFIELDHKNVSHY